MPILLRGRTFGKRRKQAIISFGNPADPNDETSDVLAGDMTAEPAHNGTLDDIDGSWVEIEFNSTNQIGQPVTFSHNLFTEKATGWPDEPEVDEPNVRWFVAGWEHSGEQATVWEDLRVPATAAQKGVTNPPGFGLFLTDGAGSTGVGLDWFDDAGEEELFFTAQIPHTYKHGSNICPHVHWTPRPGTVPAAGEVVAWGLEYTWANRGEVFPATTLIGNNVHAPADATLVPARHYVTDLGTIVGTVGDDKTVSSMLVCRVFRDATSSITNDTFNGLPANTHDAGLLEIDFHYEVDGPGSDAENDKTDTPNDVTLDWRPFNIIRQSGDDIDANSIDLRCLASPFLEVSDTHPLKVTLFFIKAVK